MAIRKVLITGSCGLVGSEAVRFFSSVGAQITGIDNDKRGDWFGKYGSTVPVLHKLNKIANYRHHSVSVINKMALSQIVQLFRPDLIIHCAAQPSHDKSAEIPFEDFMVNAAGTMNLLEAAREYCPESPFIHLSTNKVYGDRPNKMPLWEKETRFEVGCSDDLAGVGESMPIDQCLHSPFGASKASADLMVQEYGRYYDMPTACFRCGCITGADQQGVELHGFLSYLCRSVKQGKQYTIYGHKGKQVRDIIHAHDLARAFDEFANSPRKGEVYNIGGGFQNSVSILEAIKMIEDRTGQKAKIAEGAPRKGDHICYYSNLDKFKSHYPKWAITRNLDSIIDELLA